VVHPQFPSFPPYPYKAGHYPTADAYYDLPPYAATNPSFYRWRHFLMAQERNRYRYMPYIFRGYKRYPEDTVSSHTLTPEPASEPMSPKSLPKVEPSPAGPAGVLEPKVNKEDTGSSGKPGPAGSPTPQAPEGPPGASARRTPRCTRTERVRVPQPARTTSRIHTFYKRSRFERSSRSILRLGSEFMSKRTKPALAFVDHQGALWSFTDVPEMSP
jgi:hypothetical protein